MSKVTAYELARQFHERYEEQLPLEYRVPWAKAQDKRLLIEAAAQILRWLEGERDG